MIATPAASAARLMTGASTGPASLADHLDAHGPPPEIGKADGPSLIAAAAASGLRGRGGAAFPTATKMAAVADARGPAVVVVNGAEGEPMSAKDRSLLHSCPHLVLDGAMLAAAAVGARDVVLCLREDSRPARDSVTGAMAERRGRRTTRVQVAATPDLYLAGEESALVNFLNGGVPKPTFVPPRPFERGVQRRPTLVQNVETLAHLALVARHGPTWFRRAGTAQEPGTTLVTLSGAVAAPGVYEIDLGTSLADLVSAAGGATDAVRGALVGGYFGSWVDPAAAAALVLHEEHLRPLGGGLGSGVIVVLPAGACPVAETARVIAYLAREASGQCGPCTNGLGAVASAISGLARGRPERGVDERLARWTADVPGRGACHHPDGAIRFVTSALDVFADEFRDHRERGPCPACRGRAWLRTGVNPNRPPR